MKQKKFTLAALADLLEAELKGDGNLEITSLAPLQVAGAGQLSFLDNPKYRKFLPESKASAVILSADMAEKAPGAALIVKNPYVAYAMAAHLFDNKPEAKPGIHPTAIIGKECEIDPSATIGPRVVIGNQVKIGAGAVLQAGCVLGDGVELGENVWLWANVTVYHGTTIGARSTIHSGTVLGSDGFGFAFHLGAWHKIPQIGRVQIGHDVEIGANTVVDRGALGDTIIGNGVKMDNHIQIGHNVQIGDHTVIAASTGISGSTKIGKYCRIAGMVGIAGHIEIADQVVLTPMSSVAQGISEPGIYSSGIPVIPNQLWKRNIIRFQQLDNMTKRLRQLERKLALQEEETSE